MDELKRFYVDKTELELKINDPVYGFGDIHFSGRIDWEVVFQDDITVNAPDIDGAGLDDAVNLAEVDAGEWAIIMTEIKKGVAGYIDRFRFLLR